MVDARSVLKTFEPHARTLASVFRLEWVPAVGRLPTKGEAYCW